MKSVIAVVALLTACGPGQGLNDRWTVRKPVQVIIEDQPLDSTEAHRALAEGLRQLGLQTTNTEAEQTITATHDDCTCLSCNRNTAAWVDPVSYDVIRVCDRAGVAARDLGAARAADLILKHELGHVLGLRGHTPDGLLSARLDDHADIRSFTRSDITAICDAGGLASPVCL